MKRIAFLIFFLSLPSFAMRASLFPVVLEQRYIENENKEYIFQRVNALAAHLTFDVYQIGVEGGQWTKESSASLLTFKETVSEINTTYLYRMGSLTNWLHLYSGLGIGMYESKVTNSFNRVAGESKSGTILMMSGIVSLQVIYSYLHIALDLKLILAKDYQPEPTPAGVLKVGVTF